MDEQPIHLGQRLKLLQQQKAIGTTELAKFLRVAPQNVSRMHTQPDMKVSTLADICYYLEISLDEFVFDD